MSGESWQLTMVDVVRQQVMAGQSYRFTITTGSMSPFLVPGDEVIIEPVAVADLRPGEIVMIGSGEVFLAHRLERIEFSSDGVRLLTRGDRNLMRDQPWPASDLLGRVSVRVRHGKSRALRYGWGYVSCRTVGRLSRVESGLYRFLDPVIEPLIHRSRLRKGLVIFLLRGPFYGIARWLST